MTEGETYLCNGVQYCDGTTSSLPVLGNNTLLLTLP